MLLIHTFSSRFFFRFSCCNKTSLIQIPSLTYPPKKLTFSTTHFPPLPTTDIMQTHTHTFAGNPLRSTPTDNSALASSASALRAALLSSESDESDRFKVLLLKKGKPLARSVSEADSGVPVWRIGWRSLGQCRGFELGEDRFVFLGEKDETIYWAMDVSESEGGETETELREERCSYVELRTLMVATDWGDEGAMGELAIAGHAKALLEWHNTSRFCGTCGAKMIPIDAGRRKKCSNEACMRRAYPRIDPVVIMLVIDKENDCALLSRQSRFVPRMWSCLAGFMEPGESLEEAVRRETLEETGIVVGDVIYHSSQPWPVGPNSIPCQLMVGFFAYAETREIHVDKEELEDAQWHSREDIKSALTFAEYKKAQKTAAFKVNKMCMGVEKSHSFATDFNVESGELAAMFVPGPFAIAHHLISTWANQGVPLPERHPTGTSNL